MDMSRSSRSGTGDAGRWAKCGSTRAARNRIIDPAQPSRRLPRCRTPASSRPSPSPPSSPLAARWPPQSAGRRRAPPRDAARRGGDRRPVLPARRQRRHRRPLLRRPRPLRVRPGRLSGVDRAPVARPPQDLSSLQPRLPAAGELGARRRPARCDFTQDRARAGRRARRYGAGERRRRAGSRYAGRPASLRLRRREQLAGRRRRGRGDEPAAHGAVVVPGQRPPARQGPDAHQHHRAAGTSVVANGDPGQAAGPRPAGDHAPGAPTSRWRPTSRSSPPVATPSPRRAATACRGYVAVSKALPTAHAAERDGPDEADARARALAGDASSATTRSRRSAAWSPASSRASRWRTRPARPTPRRSLTRDHRRPRARPPVVRRLGRGRPVERHLAQRGRRDLHGVALRRDPRRPDGRRAGCADRYDRDRRRRRVLGARVADPCPTRPAASTGSSTVAVYQRGAMALQALRNRIGDDDFWALLRRWVADREGGNGSTAQFEALAEEVSGAGPRRVLRRLAALDDQAGRHRDNGLG